MKMTERLKLAMSVIAGETDVVTVNLKGRVVASSQNTTGGGGRMEILGTFEQRGYGGRKIGEIVDIQFSAIQEDNPQQWIMTKAGDNK